MGGAVKNRLLAQVNDRWERRAREYEDAKKQFEAAAEAVRSASSEDKSLKLRSNLNQYAVEMRVQAARRAELEWVRQVLQAPAR
jgi:hypothetical protein